MSGQMTSNVSVLIENARLSYVYVFHPMIGRNDQGQETKNYCLHAIIPPSHPAVERIKEAQRKVAAAKWGENYMQVLNQLALQHRVPLHDGALKGGEGYEGNLYVSANSRVKPRVLVTRNGQNVDIGESDPCAPYSGCYGNVIVDIWAQQHPKWGRRINAQLTGVQFLRHGDRFGGGRVARVDEFGLAPVDADGAVPAAVMGAGTEPAMSSLI